MASPPVGTNSYTNATWLTCLVTNSPVVVHTTQSMITAVCTGWTGTGSVPALGATTNTPTFAISNNSSIAWQWRITDVVLSNQVITGTTNYEASGSIQAGGQFVVDPGADVTMTAGESVRLKPGFSSRTGSQFRANIDTEL